MTVDSRALVGRSAELTAIGDVLAEARSGRASLALIIGEAGIGKSRLAEEAVQRAGRLDMAVAWGRTWEAGGAPAFWPWIQVLRGLRAGEAAEPPELARLLPELGRAPSHGETADERFALFDAVLRFLAAAGARRPALVVLEDLHAADLPSLELLAFVAAHMRDSSIALLATMRDLELRLSAPRRDLVDRIRRCGAVIAPRRLEPDETAALVAATPSVALDRAAVDRIHRATEGNPLFVTEMMHMLAAGADTPIPDGARSLIRERLAALPDGPRGVLEVAAAIGREFAAPLLAAACELPLGDVLADLGAAAAAGLVVEHATARYRFSHGLFAEALRGELSAAVRSRLHRRIAGELERLHAHAAPMAEIANHLLEAGPESAVTAIGWARRAAEQAIRQLAFEEGAALLERALAAAALTPDRRGRAELLLDLARARSLAGDVRRGQDACREAAALARTAGDPQLLARAAIGFGAEFRFGKTDRALVDLLEEALEALPGGDSPLRARLLGRLAAALQPAADPTHPIGLARQAIEMARRVGDDRDRLEVLHVSSAGLVKYAPPGEREAIDEETRRLATRLGEPALALRASGRLVIDFLELGDLGAAQQHMQAYDELAAALPFPSVRWLAPMFRAMLALYQGRFADHAEHVAEAARWAARTGDDLARCSLEMHEVGLLRTRGDDAGLEGKSSSLWRQLRESAGVYERWMHWMILGRLGRVDELRAALARHDPEELVAMRDPLVASWVGEAVAVARDRRWAEPLFAWLETIPRQVALQGTNGMFIDGPVGRVLYLLADVLDRREVARAHVDEVLAHAQRHGARPLEARVRYEWGNILRRRGEADEARRWLTEARDAAASLGIPLADRIEGEVVPARAAPDAPVSLEREGEYWTVTGEGGVVRVRHSRGLDMLARLVAQPAREIHVLELTGAGEADGDSGPAIDREARDAYRGRLRELEAELAEAEEWNDSARVERLRGEAEALRAELARAIGLGGRPRRVGAAAERARVNAQRRLADAIQRIRACHAPLGAHLAGAVRTGLSCSYDPGRVRR